MNPERHRWIRILTWVDLSLATIAQRLTTELDSHERLSHTTARTPPALSPTERATISQLARTCREGMTYTDRLASSLQENQRPEPRPQTTPLHTPTPATRDDTHD